MASGLGVRVYGFGFMASGLGVNVQEGAGVVEPNKFSSSYCTKT